MSHPIPFVELVGDKFRVTEESKEYLRKITNPVGVVVVAGLYRTGKSYILNKLVDQAGGFRVGNTVQACTKGLWIWGAPVEITFNGNKKGSLIFMDTEGLGGPNATKTYDGQIMSLALLLASFFIYNSMGTIDQNAINDLALTLSLANRIKAKERAENRSERDVFPNFMWLLRDFALRLEDEDGKAITSQQYFERSLVVLDEKSGGESAKSSNQMRKAIVDGFSRRSCITLPRPTNEETDLQKLDSLSDRLLRENFKSGITELKRIVYSECPIKTVMGNIVTGEVLLGITEEYVSAINNGAIPSIGGAFEGVVFRLCVTAYEDAVAIYKQKFDEMIKSAPNGLEDTQLHALHEKLSSEVYARYRSAVISRGEQEEKYYEKLHADISAHYNDRRQSNFHDSLAKCTAYLERIINDYIYPELKKNQFTRLDEVIGIWKEALDHYHKEAVGPGKYLAYHHITTSSFVSSILLAHNFLSDQLRHQHADQIIAKQSIIASTESELRKMKDELESQKAEHEQTIQNLRERVEISEQNITRYQAKLNTAKENAEAKEDELKRLGNQIDEKEAKLFEAEEEKARLKEENEKLHAKIQELEQVSHSVQGRKRSLEEDTYHQEIEANSLSDEMIGEEHLAEGADTSVMRTPHKRGNQASHSPTGSQVSNKTGMSSTGKRPRKSVGEYFRGADEYSSMPNKDLIKLLKDHKVQHNAKNKADLIEVCIENNIKPHPGGGKE